MTRTDPLVADQHTGREAGRTTPSPALAVFCCENPDSCRRPVTWPDGRRPGSPASRPFTCSRRQPFELDVPGVMAHAVGECDRADLLEQVQEFTSRAGNAFLHAVPRRQPARHPDGLRVVRRRPARSAARAQEQCDTILSLHSLERQRSDMTARSASASRRSEQTALRESQAILLPASRPPPRSARFWVPECAGRIVARASRFPIEHFDGKVDPGAVKARYQVGPIDPTILFVGDLSERYGPDLLVKAMPAILKNHTQARLIVVGDGDLFWPLRVYARYLLLEHAVRLPGNVEGQPLHELIQAADVIVVPSRESTPWWPILAAWAASRPVVATHQAAPGLLEHEQRQRARLPQREQPASGASSASCTTPTCGQTSAPGGRDKLEERFGWNTRGRAGRRADGRAARCKAEPVTPRITRIPRPRIERVRGSRSPSDSRL